MNEDYSFKEIFCFLFMFVSGICAMIGIEYDIFLLIGLIIFIVSFLLLIFFFIRRKKRERMENIEYYETYDTWEWSSPYAKYLLARLYTPDKEKKFKHRIEKEHESESL